MEARSRLPRERHVGGTEVPHIIRDLHISPRDGGVTTQDERLVDQVGSVTVLHPDARVPGMIRPRGVWGGNHRAGTAVGVGPDPGFDRKFG
eukprot:COSAG01_NODE_6104_length_3849_cov_4.556267_5_plen_91_part_00